MSKKSDWTLLRFCQHRQLGLWGWGWTIKSLCCHLRIWRLETVMQGRPSYTPQTLKTLPGIPWSDGSFDNQPGHNLTTTRQPTPVCLFQLLVFYSHMLHVLFCITYGVNMHMLLGKKENALNFCQYEWGAPLQVIKTNVHGQIQTLYLIIITASYNSQARVTRGVNGN